MTDLPPLNVETFDALSAEDASVLLEPVCASHAWSQAVIEGRPYGSLDALAAESDAVLLELGWNDIGQALAAHPRIGERATGTGQEATWSQQEQSTAFDPTAQTAADLYAANLAYEQRFGQVFLICATGRTAEEIVAEARRRLTNDIATEQDEVRRELAAIVRLRLAKTLA